MHGKLKIPISCLKLIFLGAQNTEYNQREESDRNRPAQPFRDAVSVTIAEVLLGLPGCWQDSGDVVGRHQDD